MRIKKTTALLFVFIIGLTAVILVMKGPFSQKPSTLQLLDTNELTSMIDKKEDMVIVDLREPELFAEARIPDTINIPFAEIRTRYQELPKNKKIVFVCHTGRMGKESGNLLLENGYKQVYNLEGGMAQWTGKQMK